MSAIVRRRIIAALVVSLLIHISFLVWSYFVKILPATPLPENVQNVFHVKIEKEIHVGNHENLKFEKELSQKSPKPENPFNEDKPQKPSVESEELIKNNVESSILRNKESLVPSSPQKNEVLRKSEFTDIITTRKVRRSPRENFVELGEVPTEKFSSGAPVLNSGEDISRYFLDKSAMPANAPLASPLQAANTQNQFEVMKQSSQGTDKESMSMDLGTALTYQLLKYKDLQGNKYFKLSVKVRDATLNFPVIPKEIIFLVDASGSIGMQRLAQVEEGIVYSLKHLNPNDRFNIFVFKDKNNPFSPVSVPPTADNIRKAVEFLKDQKSWSTTDIYDALRNSINLKGPFVPSYRVFISDGIPTVGILDDRHVINQISDLNDNKVSIFTFGGGADVDPYMLDFIAFKNRGWSTVVDREYFMAREFARFYNEIKDPLLLNVRYYISGLNDKEIFPQTMPDFFKGSQFVIYGKYTDEDKFVMQVRGNMLHEKKEFIVSGSLKNANSGDKSIAHDWAFHKVYYLISLLKYDENNQELLAQIKALCQKFHIITPYSFNEQEPAKALTKARIINRRQKAANTKQ